MRPDTASTIITSAALTVAIVAFFGWSSHQSVMDREAKLSQAAIEGRAWMGDVTTKLDRIHTGVQRLTADTIELTRQVDDLNERMNKADL
jgi:hypothetical protein